jgi:hypothetical protein
MSTEDGYDDPQKAGENVAIERRVFTQNSDVRQMLRQSSSAVATSRNCGRLALGFERVQPGSNPVRVWIEVIRSARVKAFQWCRGVAAARVIRERRHGCGAVAMWLARRPSLHAPKIFSTPATKGCRTADWGIAA